MGEVRERGAETQGEERRGKEQRRVVETRRGEETERR